MACALVPVAAGAQGRDPYASDQQRLAYQVAEQTFPILGWALGCGVIDGAHAEVVMNAQVGRLYQLGAPPTQSFLDEINAKFGAAQKRAATPGACDFWHDHPEEVQSLREQTDAALASAYP